MYPFELFLCRPIMLGYSHVIHFNFAQYLESLVIPGTRKKIHVYTLRIYLFRTGDFHKCMKKREDLVVLIFCFSNKFTSCFG